MIHAGALLSCGLDICLRVARKARTLAAGQQGGGLRSGPPGRGLFRKITREKARLRRGHHGILLGRSAGGGGPFGSCASTSFLGGGEKKLYRSALAAPEYRSENKVLWRFIGP